MINDTLESIEENENENINSEFYKKFSVDEKLSQFIKEWENDTTMSRLMGGFKSSRDVDPHDWDNKLPFWINVLFYACQLSSTITIDANRVRQLLKRRRRKDRSCVEQPLGWKTVMNELRREKRLLSEEEFNHQFTGVIESYTDMISAAPGRASSWMLRTAVVSPVSWMWSSVMGSADEFTPGHSFVFIDAVQEASNILSKQVYQNQSTPIDLLIPPQEIRKILIGYSDDDIRKIQNYMTHQYQAFVVVLNDNQRGLKFPLDSHSRRYLSISDADRAVLHIKSTKHKLEQQESLLHQQIDKSAQDAGRCIQKRQRSIAQKYLERKRAMELALKRRLGSIQNLQAMLDKMEEAHSDSEVLDSYKSGANALREYTPNKEEVEESMEDVMDALADFSDIQSAMDQDLGLEQDFDEDELIAEMDQLNLNDNNTESKNETKNISSNEISKQNDSNDKSSKLESNQNIYTVDLSEIPSLSVAKWELSNIQQVIDQTGSNSAKEQKEQLELLIQLFTKKHNKAKQENTGNNKYMEELKERTQNLEKKAFEHQSEGNMKKALLMMKYQNLVDEEIEEIKNEQSKVESSADLNDNEINTQNNSQQEETQETESNNSKSEPVAI
eukprot:gb/GECH01001062.1/.p1 GENE.gb/GECH01001062.1/~~gb/GECH01001062.1/.p1  ORF type:complete len:614 (+),score=194.16 gb/GECH01001062.1/:1-1842(+)